MASRHRCSRESSYDSTISNSSYTKGTIHQRRTISRTSTSSLLPLPPSLDGFTELFQSRTSTQLITPVPKSSTADKDRARWVRMLKMQQEFHCYKSARLEAAVEALDNGVPLDEVPIPSSLCLDLINEGLEAQIEANKAPYAGWV